jgi:HAD superfamily hydrolase (TIGR01490 family)
VGIAFFDFDGTLITVNSATLWVRQEVRLGRMTTWQALRAAAWLGKYQLGFAEIDHAFQRAIAALAGSEEHELRERTASFYQSRIRSLYRPGALRAVEQHRNAGDTLVLLTSAPIYLSELVARELKLDAQLCNRFEVNAQGIHTGRTVGALCYGTGKLSHAKAFAQDGGVALANCAFYTDSYSDLPVLEAVGRPVAVNPDRRLRRTAVQRGWELVDWGRPA